jgi:hypothetical protein
MIFCRILPFHATINPPVSELARHISRVKELTKPMDKIASLQANRSLAIQEFSPHLMETQSSLPHLQEPATSVYPAPINQVKAPNSSSLRSI